MKTFYAMDSEIRSYFNRFTKDELMTILSYFEQTCPKKAKKVELVDMVTAFIGGNPREWLYRLPERDLRTMRDIAYAGPENWVRMDSPEYPSVAALLGLIYIDDNSFDDIMTSMDFSLFFPVASIIDQVIADKERDGSFRTERSALGILNIYGAVPVEEFVEKVFDMYDEDGSGKDVTLAMAECPVVSMNRVFYNDSFYIISPYAYDYENIIDGRKDFEEIKEYRMFSKEDALNAGTGSPYCAFRNQECYAVREVLEALGYEGKEIDEEIHSIWLNAQHAANETSAEAIFSCVNSKIDDIESFDIYRRYVDVIAAYANSVPKWLLKGETSSDAGLLQLSIKIDESVMDGNNLEEEAVLEEELGPLKDYYKYNMAVRHVCPDDPCPCGSGLSYCRCHGKRLN